MESFPKDLLVGVFPVVFAINCTEGGRDTSKDAEAPRSRNRFEKFLDVLVASLLSTDLDGSVDGATLESDKRRSVSLFRSDDDDYSSDDDTFEEQTSRKRSTNAFSANLSSNIYPPFRRRTFSRSSVGSAHSVLGGNILCSYAKALALGQSFFERARIESCAATHGFPPSRDPEGNKNFAWIAPESAKARDTNKLKEIFKKHPPHGIMPAGWLEKHAEALPSIILVVSTVTSNGGEQIRYDEQLFNTIQHLSESLATKRKCKVHVVGLMEESVTDNQAQVWTQAVVSQLQQNHDYEISVSLIHSLLDLDFIDSGLPPGLAVKRLQHAVRDASLAYYVAQARRNKEKLRRITEENRNMSQPPSEQILPWVIRYCIKVAFFYEFQLKYEKSIRFFAEAYRHLCHYFHYLQSVLAQGTETNDVDLINQTAPKHHTDVSHDGVEVELSTDNNGPIWKAVVPPPPPDMMHQCLAVAEWINLKLLNAGFASREENGFVAAAVQWREHQRVFCAPLKCNQDFIPDCLHLSYVARQRLVFQQLLERHPFSSYSDFDLDSSEYVEFFSPWRTSLAAVEGLLRLSREVDRAKQSTSGDSDTASSGNSRDSFIGSLSSSGAAALVRQEGKSNYREQALLLALKAESLYETELRKEKRGFFADDSFRESSSSRSGARLSYLIGGILLGMNRHAEAVGHLEKATKYAKGWRELELAIRKLLIECYEKHVPSHTDPMANESSRALASMILDSYFNAEMSSQDLRRALGQFSHISGAGSLKWYRESFNDEDPDSPFTFEVTFPENIFATIGDSVKASIFIKSNLDYAVHVNSVVLLSLAGELPISPNDLMRATNASEGSHGGVIIQKNIHITIETELVLPRDLSFIAADDSGNGGEMYGVAGKGSFAKSARPRTAGLTSAGGARLLPADMISRENKVTQGWSLRFLGGKPLKCDGLRVVFYPVQVGKASGSSDQVPLIELTVEKKKPRTAVDIKRTAFEDENYIASAWSRPQSLPLSRGPRSLRVLGPQPQMVITNITENFTDGKALEGTVNRVVLKLQSGPTEVCADLQFRVSCFSFLVTADGVTKRLVSQENLSSEAETAVDMKSPKYRTPVLVSESPLSSKQGATDYGFSLPVGWKLADSGQGFDGKIRLLKEGDAAYLNLDFYRPSPIMHAGEAEIINGSLCKTDFYVTVTYRKEKPMAKRRPPVRPGRGSQMRGSGIMGRGRGRDDYRQSFGSEGQSEQSADFPDETKAALEDVTLDFSGVVIWSKPMDAIFSPGAIVGLSLGTPPPVQAATESKEPHAAPFVTIDGGKVSAKCTLRSENAPDELRTEIAFIRFRENEQDSSIKVNLFDSFQENVDKQLYKATIDDTCRILAPGSKFSVSYLVEVRLAAVGIEGERYVRGNLGSVEVDWSPFPIRLAPDITLESKPKNSGCHGPLRLEHQSTIIFQGPTCEVQRAPFIAKISIIPPVPRAALPFQLKYTIENLTMIHQSLTIQMSEKLSDNGDPGLLFSGIANGSLVLGPLETQEISYTAVATRPGNLLIPSLCISSNKYKTWVGHETSGNRKPLYIFP